MWRAVWNWLGMVGMLGWTGRVWWVDRQKLWFEGERLGGGGVVDVAWVRWRRTSGRQGLRLERQRCEEERMRWRRWDPWMQQWSRWVVGGWGKEGTAGMVGVWVEERAAGEDRVL